MSGSQAALARLTLPVGALCLCAIIDPHQPSGVILCPFRLLTGISCPLCGMTRGLASLLRGRLSDALAFHFFSPFVLAVIAAWIVIETGQAMRLWNARPIGLWALRPAPWLAFIGICTIYGALRWCGIIKSPLA